MNKLIGIPDKCDSDVASIGINYTNAVIIGGNIPVVLPRTTDKAIISEMVAKTDAILLAGGCDIDPKLFGENPSPYLGTVVPERDAFEYAVIEAAVAQNKPIFGICRGIQIINVFFGGTLYQDLATEVNPEAVIHQRPDKEWEPVHEINIVKDSRLHRLLGTERIGVNSTHHQAVKDLAPDFHITATSDDGIVEAIESDKYQIFCVQFHPERLVNASGSLFNAIFETL